MVTAFEKAKIIQLKGLGFSVAEISGKLGLRPGQVKYWARKIEEEARAEGEDTVFIRVMADAATPKVLELMELAGKLK